VRSRQIIPLMIDRFCSGRRPSPRFAASIGSKPFKNTPFRFGQVAPAQACLQKAGLNQPLRAASTNSSTPPRKRGETHRLMSVSAQSFISAPLAQIRGRDSHTRDGFAMAAT
jgi:hypothetical protein